MGSPDVTVVHETSLEIKDEPVGSELEILSVDNTSSEEVFTQNHLESIVVPCQITVSNLQQAVTQRDLRCTTSIFKPAKAKRELNVFFYVSENISLMFLF